MEPGGEPPPQHGTEKWNECTGGKWKKRKVAEGEQQVRCEMGFPFSLCYMCLFVWTGEDVHQWGGKHTHSEGLIIPIETTHEQRLGVLRW